MLNEAPLSQRAALQCSMRWFAALTMTVTYEEAQ